MRNIAEQVEPLLHRCKLSKWALWWHLNKKESLREMLDLIKDEDSLRLFCFIIGSFATRRQCIEIATFAAVQALQAFERKSVSTAPREAIEAAKSWLYNRAGVDVRKLDQIRKQAIDAGPLGAVSPTAVYAALAASAVVSGIRYRKSASIWMDTTITLTRAAIADFPNKEKIMRGIMQRAVDIVEGEYAEH